MNPPSVLLDHSFLIALADPGDTNHSEALATYRALIDDFVEQRCLLVARADHLTAVANPDLCAAIDKLHVARQHRNAAADLAAQTGVGIEEAITLVLIYRHRFRTVASFDERLARYDIDLIASVPPSRVASDMVAADTLGMSAATKLAPGLS